MDFDDSLAGADDLLEGLGPAAGAEFDALDGVGSFSQLSEGERGELEGGMGAAGEKDQLRLLLLAAADASGTLAAVDAGHYVTGLALQQCQRARQQHCAELAAFQWVNEHLLPPEAAAATAGLLAAVELSASAAASAGAALPPLHPSVAAWALRGSRGQVLEQLEAGLATLLSLQAPLQQWETALAGLHQQMAGEVAATTPYTVAQLQHQLAQQQQWLSAAAGHTAHLVEASQAVLQFEAARTADTQASDEAGATQQPSLGRYHADQQAGWRRYTALVRHMQQLHSSYEAAERRLAVAASELEQLHLRRVEATTIMQSAEEAGSNAAAGFAATALPLVRSTQQLPTAVAQVLPLLAGCGDWERRLRLGQHWAAELAEGGVGAVPAATAKEASEAAQRLAAAAACLRELPSAVSALQEALLPVRNKLLAGGRGEAAAKQQAAHVVDALSAVVLQLQPQLERAAEVQSWLPSLPASLQALAAQASQHACALQEQHGFSLDGLQQLVQGQVAGAAPVAVTVPAAARHHGALTGSLMLAGPNRRRGLKQQEEWLRYAATQLQRFRRKLLGEEAGAADGGGATAEVPAAVQELIAAAVAPANLSRMYEGWMPWV